MLKALYLILEDFRVLLKARCIFSPHGLNLDQVHKMLLSVVWFEQLHRYGLGLTPM